MNHTFGLNEADEVARKVFAIDSRILSFELNLKNGTLLMNRLGDYSFTEARNKFAIMADKNTQKHP